mgnify:CR=1 FL=1
MLLAMEKAFHLLQRYGIAAPRYFMSKTISEAQLAAHNLQFPVVIKADSPDIIHKSDHGCVRIAYTEQMFDTAYKHVLKNAQKQTHHVRGVLVQEHVTGVECIVGSALDSQFGKTIMFGSGGVFIEALHDVSFRLVPITPNDAKSMIHDTVISWFIESNRRPINHTALVDILLRVSDMVQRETIEELDINPLFVNEKGALAADVRILV